MLRSSAPPSSLAYVPPPSAPQTGMYMTESSPAELRPRSCGLGASSASFVDRLLIFEPVFTEGRRQIVLTGQTAGSYNSTLELG